MAGVHHKCIPNRTTTNTISKMDISASLKYKWHMHINNNKEWWRICVLFECVTVLLWLLLFWSMHCILIEESDDAVCPQCHSCITNIAESWCVHLVVRNMCTWPAWPENKRPHRPKIKQVLLYVIYQFDLIASNVVAVRRIVHDGLSPITTEHFRHFIYG